MEPAPATPIAHQRFMAPCEIIEPATIRSSVMGSGNPMAAMVTIPKRAGAPYCETAARWMRGGIDGALQLGYQFWHGAVQVVSDMANGSPVMRLARRNPNRLKQHGGGDVVGMGNEWDRHPAMD